MPFRSKLILIIVLIAIFTIGTAVALVPITDWIRDNIMDYAFSLARAKPMIADDSIDRDPAFADGTFIQWWLAAGWDDEMWSKELAILKEAGMHYIILTPTVIRQKENEVSAKSSANGSGESANIAIYPTEVPSFEIMKQADGSDYPDVVELCLRNAKAFGFKVFIGLNFSDDWWSCQYSREWVIARMNEGNELAADLWKRYHDRYGDTFYGWYWCWEVSNSYIRNMNLINSREVLAEALMTQTSFLEKEGMRLPIMFSPYMNRWYGTPQTYAEMWKYVFANSGLQQGDVFCVQDSVGAGGLKIENLPDWYGELRKAADTIPGLQFWSDTETFDISDWTSVPIRRFILQMEVVRPYVDNIVTFAYSHYYSPNIIDGGFHRTYLDYIYAGMIDTIMPSIPERFTVKPLTPRKVGLGWGVSEDNIGICGYYVYRNGEMVANLQTPRNNCGKPDEIPTEWIDDDLPDGVNSFNYEVKAYDFAGNASLSAGPVNVVPGAALIN